MLIVALFFVLPMTTASVCLIAMLLGLTGASTVPPSSLIVNRICGAARLGTFFGLSFLSLQAGAFFGAWLGGVCVQTTGGYGLIWAAAASLSILAAVCCFFAKDERA